MASLFWVRAFTVAALLATLLGSVRSRAQEASDAKKDPPEGVTPANSGLQREYARLAQLLNSDDTFGKREAAETLLKVRPSDIPNADTRKLIARGYRSMAMDDHGFDQETAVRGLVIWGGKYSVPVLIEIMDKDGRHPSDEVFSALAQLKDPKGAEAIANHLGDFFSHDQAVSALRRMGTAAEDALIAAAPDNDPKKSLAAVQLLGDVGGEKSLPILTKASAARNLEVKQTARDAIKKIRARQKTGASPDAEKVEDPDSPFAEGAGPPVDITARNTRPSGFPGDEEADAAAVDLNEGDWSQVSALLPGDPAGAGVAADPGREIFDPNWKPQPVRLGKTMSRTERPTHVCVAGGASPVAVVLHADPFNDTLARLEFVNLKQRKSIKSSNIVGGVGQIRLSPSGTRMLVASKEASHKDTARLDVYGLNNGVALEQVTWWPYATTDDHWGSQIYWCEWVDEDQLLTLNGQGMLVLWRLEGKNAKAVYQIDADSNSTPVLSPGGGQLALMTQRGAEIFRVSDGELLARMTGDAAGGGYLAFNQAGDRLACISSGNICVWNTTNGKLERDFYCNGLRGESIEWLDDNHLCVGGSDIVDLERRLIAWRYETAQLAGDSYGGWRWLVMTSGNVLGIAPTRLLQPEVLEAAKEVNADEALALKPGAKVALDIQLGGEEQAKAEAALKAALEQNGMEVVSDSPIRISAQIVTGNSETKEYGRGFFNRENTEQVTTTEKRFEVEVKVDGQSIWKQSSLMQSAGGPGLVQLKEGETAQQVIDRQNAENAQRFGFGASLPRYVVHPKYAGPLGTSRVAIGRR